MAKSKVYAVFGLGSFGVTLCDTLIARGDRVIAIDDDAEQVESVKNRVSAALVLDSTDEKAMGKAPLEEVDIAVVAIGDQIEASVLTTALLKRNGVPYILARASTPVHKMVLEAVGANEVVNPEEEGAIRVAQRFLAAESLDIVPLSSRYSLAERAIPKSLTGMSLSSMNLLDRFGLTAVGLLRQEATINDDGETLQEERLIPVNSDPSANAGDILLVIGDKQNLDRFGNLE